MQALDLYRRVGDLPDESDLHNDIGRVCVDADLLDTALSQCHLARLIACQIGSQPVQVTGQGRFPAIKSLRLECTCQ